MRKKRQPDQHYHVLNLGAGVQSTTLALLFAEGTLTPMPHVAIFADTQEEPSYVYPHVEWLRQHCPFPIWVRTKGKLGDDLLKGQNSRGGRFASIPAFTKHADGKRGQVRRQCTSEYKLEPIKQAVRRELLGLPKGGRVKKHITIHHYIGISADEAGRSTKIRARCKKYEAPHFPLLELDWTRRECADWLLSRVPHQVRRSACVFCPYRDDSEWLSLQEHDPAGWQRALEIDRALRIPGNVVNRKMNEPMFLHDSLVPLEEVVFNVSRKYEQNRFKFECVGMCGN